MKMKGLTITYIVKAFPMNYDEGFGNVSVMKKVHRGDGTTVPFTSRQALRYSLTQWLFNNGYWKMAELTKKEGVVQYDEDRLKEYFYEEADLFGYMITKKGDISITRSAVARLSHLIGLEPYFGDQEFLTNKGFADRINEEPNIANIETAYTYYKYTLSVDLDSVGVDDNFNHNIPDDEKIGRVKTLLEATKFLYRDIRGRREDLKPLLVIGGVFPIKNPFFHNAVKIEWKGGKAYISLESIREVLEIGLPDGKVKDYTFGGIVSDEFGNSEEFKGLGGNLGLTPYEAIDRLKEKVEEAYKVR